MNKNFLADLASVIDLKFDQYDDPNKSWIVWITNFLMTLNKHAPLKNRRVKERRTPLINDDLILGNRYKKYLTKKAVKYKLLQDWAVLKFVKNQNNGNIKCTKRSYYMSQLYNNMGDIKNTC